MVKQLKKDLSDVPAFFQLAPDAMAQAENHEHHRTGFRGGTKTNATDGLLRERGQRRPNHLFHLSENSISNGGTAASKF
jgi:hypothetical protein